MDEGVPILPPIQISNSILFLVGLLLTFMDSIPY